jgi:AcrR family transcriptional regulator
MPTRPSGEPSRQIRADALRNRASILDAARRAFADQGTETHIVAIAERAGVGVGTVYRHFPTKEALRDALIADQLEAMEAELVGARAAEASAWDAFRRFFRAVAQMQIRDRSLMQFITGTSIGSVELELKRDQLYAQARDLMQAAQEEGSMRQDAEPGDIPLLLGGIAQVLAVATTRAHELGERCVAIVLDGLAAPGSTPLPGHALDQAQVRKLFRGEASRERSTKARPA